MKVCLIALIAVDFWGQTITEENSFKKKDSSNLCTKFTLAKKQLAIVPIAPTARGTYVIILSVTKNIANVSSLQI